MTVPRTTPPRKLLYVANEDWAFLLNRLPMARAARRAGYEVHVATCVGQGAAAIEYGLLAAGIAVAIIAVVAALGTNLNTTFSTVSTSLK